jgi:glutathione S-transferase
MVELLHLPYSPWSEKARWALEARGIPYRARHYQPLLGELALRVRLGRPRGPVGVPVLRDGSQVIADSFSIACYAEARGSGPRLFPEGREVDVVRYNDLSERGLAAGRALAMQRVLQSPAALLELVPRGLRKRLGGLAPRIAAVGVKRTLRKWGATAESHAEHERTFREVLDTLRADLAAGAPDVSRPGGPLKTLLGTFSYADIAMAQVLAYVAPPATGLKIGPGNREAFGDPALAARYVDLLAWRDALYLQHRSTV